MKKFKPTYLYIKQHLLTGLKYFGKTNRNEEFLLYKYYGSGKTWNKHLEQYGREHVVTIWYKLFDNESELKQFALEFSSRENIVESKDWANLKKESGIDGGGIGRPGWVPSQETRNLWKEQRKGRKISEKTKLKWKKIKRGVGENNPFFNKFKEDHPCYNLKHSTEEKIARSIRQKLRMSDPLERKKIGDRFARKFFIISPTGENYTIINLARWCKEKNFLYSTVRNGKKGWKCQEI